jgi:hypothetical protein
LRLLDDPGTGRVDGHPGDVYAAGGDLDEEEHVDPFEEDGVDGEKVARQDATGLGGEELLPRGPGAAGCGVDAGPVQDVPYGAGRDLVAETDQLTVDAPMAPGRIVGGQAQHQVPDLAGDGWTASPGMQVRPAAGDQLAVPAQQRGRGDEEDRPAGPGE